LTVILAFCKMFIFKIVIINYLDLKFKGDLVFKLATSIIKLKEELSRRFSTDFLFSLRFLQQAKNTVTYAT
jgi:predicted nucleotidyltransferase component of viral defense system